MTDCTMYITNSYDCICDSMSGIFLSGKLFSNHKYIKIPVFAILLFENFLD